MATEKVWNKKRELLEAEVIRASLALLSYTGALGFSLPILRSAQTYVVVGSEESIKNWKGSDNEPVVDSNR